MLYSILVFIVVFIIYLHWVEQYKTGEDLEIYEIDYTDNAHLQDVCKSKQPIVFEFMEILGTNHFFKGLLLSDLVDKYGNLDMYVKDTDEFWIPSGTSVPNGNTESVPLSLNATTTLMKTDTHSHYITDGNEDFVAETVLERFCDSLDDYIKPSFTVYKTQDIWFGSKNAATPMRYNTNYSHFLFVCKGKIRVKMTPQRSKKYLHPRKDMPSCAAVNVWNPPDEYQHDFSQIQFLDFDIYEGNILYIPPYWWYSLQYEEEDTFLCSIQYNTIMNVVAHSHHTLGSLWQKYTTPVKPAKVLKIDKREPPMEEIIVPSL